MSRLIRQLCGMSILCGAAMNLTPEGSIRRVMNVLCSAVLITCLLGGVRGFDYEVYADELARNGQREQRFRQEAEDARDRFSRLVIQDRVRAYILDKAGQRGLTLENVTVQTEWNTDGFWVPRSIVLEGYWQEEERETFSRLLAAELGVPEERQEWRLNG